MGWVGDVDVDVDVVVVVGGGGGNGNGDTHEEMWCVRRGCECNSHCHCERLEAVISKEDEVVTR